ncbi:MAG: molybdate transport system regulatory protein [Cellvibrionaceae bacterium]
MQKYRWCAIENSLIPQLKTVRVAHFQADPLKCKLMTPKFNLWLETDDKVALSIWRIRLLAAVGEAGSISQAAASMEVPYRIAWQKIKEMESLLGENLVETQIGGASGGGAELTLFALGMIDKFSTFSEKVQPHLQNTFDEIFGNLDELS